MCILNSNRIHLKILLHLHFSVWIMTNYKSNLPLYNQVNKLLLICLHNNISSFIFLFIKKVQDFQLDLGGAFF